MAVMVSTWQEGGGWRVAGGHSLAQKNMAMAVAERERE